MSWMDDKEWAACAVRLACSKGLGD